MKTPEAPAPSRANAADAGNEAITSPDSSQRFPTKDNPQSHLRNALQLLELMYAENRGAASFGIGQCVVERKALDAAGQRIVQALHLMEQPAPVDPQQIVIDDFRPKQLAFDATGAP